MLVVATKSYTASHHIPTAMSVNPGEILLVIVEGGAKIPQLSYIPPQCFLPTDAGVLSIRINVDYVSPLETILFSTVQ